MHDAGLMKGMARGKAMVDISPAPHIKLQSNTFGVELLCDVVPHIAACASMWG